MSLTEIRDGVRQSNLTTTVFNCADHRDLIFEKLAEECGFSKTGIRIWTHLKDKNYSIQIVHITPNTPKVWVEYKFESESKVIDTPSISDFIDEVLSFIRDFYKNRLARA